MQNAKKRIMQKISPFLWFDGRAEEAAGVDHPDVGERSSIREFMRQIGVPNRRSA